jgi:uncharacterized protein YndB with AHSA1/START domain
VFRFDVTVDIAASPARVWRALCDPAEVVRWDTGIVGAIDAPPEYPRPGHYVRWRYRNGPFRLLHDRPQDVVPERTLRSLLAVGPSRFDETYTLAPTADGCRLTASMIVSTPIPLLGPLLTRVYAGPAARSSVQASMRALKRFCEASSSA